MHEGSDLEATRAAVHREWTTEEQVAKWRRRHPQLHDQSRAATELIVTAAGVVPGMRVLDVACGNGEPSLDLAYRVGPTGHVTGVDLSPPMLTEARERARKRDLPNVTFQVGEAEALPFEDRFFDAVTCRFGIMYVWDPERALSEALRVLRRNGRAALLVWGPPEESTVFLNRSVASRYAQLPDWQDIPNRLRFARFEKLAAALERAGFAEVAAEKHVIPWLTCGPLEDIQAGAPFHELIDALPDAQQERARSEVLSAMRECYDGACCNHTAAVIVAVGRRRS